MMHQRQSLNGRDKRGAMPAPKESEFLDGSLPIDYATVFVQTGKKASTGAVAAERRENAPLLLRCLQTQELQGIDASVLDEIFEVAVEWLEALGEEVDPSDSELAETLTLLAVHAFMLAPYRTSAVGDTALEYGKAGSPDDFDTDRAIELAESFARRLVEARSSQDDLANATAAAIYAIVTVAGLAVAAPTFGETIIGTLLRCPARHRVLPLLPYLVPRPAVDGDDGRSEALAATLGGFVARALASNEATDALAAAEILPVVVEIYGPTHTGLDGVLSRLGDFPIAASQPDVPRGPLKRSLMECEEGLADPDSVDRIFMVSKYVCAPLFGFYGLRRVHFVECLYRSANAVPATIDTALFGAAVTSKHAFNKDDGARKAHHDGKAREERMRGVERQRARDSKHQGSSECE